MGAVIEICVKNPGGRPRMKVTSDWYMCVSSYSTVVDVDASKKGKWLIQERGVRNKNDDQPQDRGWLCLISNLS